MNLPVALPVLSRLSLPNAKHSQGSGGAGKPAGTLARTPATAHEEDHVTAWRCPIPQP
jgi:hypothetical protein